jgi:PKD repeat protein
MPRWFLLRQREGAMEILKEKIFRRMFILLTLLFIGVLALASNIQLAKTDNYSVNFGDIVFASIDPAGEVDTYTFSANAGDAIFVRMTRISGSLDPEIRLRAPNGTELAMNWAYDIAEIWYTLPYNGEYTVLAFNHFGGNYTGDYSMFIQRLNNPGNTILVGFGETAFDSINQAGDADTYTFSASVGDSIFIRVSRTSGALDPEVRLYVANGTEVTRSWAYDVAEIAYTLTDGGECLALAFDYSGTGVGNYSMFVQRLNNPGNEVHVASDNTVFASIELAGEVDTYVFSASAGDTVFVRMSQTLGALDPEIRLYAPNGTELTRSWAYDIAEISYTLTDSGQHSALAFDYSGIGTGNYSIFLSGATGPVENNPPYQPQLSITPSLAVEDNDDLIVTVIGPTPADPNNDTVTYTYKWFVDTGTGEFLDDELADRGDHTGSTVPAADTEVGDTWRVEVTPADQYGAVGPSAIATWQEVGAIKPVADAGSDQTVNEDTIVTFNGSNSSSSNNTVSYVWAFTDGTPKNLTGINPTYNFTTPGTYPVTLNVTDATGNWDTDTVIITVLDVTDPKAEANIDQVVVQDKTMSFDAINSSDNVGIVTYEWNFGDGTNGTGSAVNHTYAEPGNYTVTLTVRDAAGNEDMHFINVTVLPAETPLEPRSVEVVAEVVAIVAAVTTATTVVGSGIGQSFNSAVSKLPFPDEIKQFLKFYGEKIFETVDKAKLAALQKASFITKEELAALGISTSVVTIVLSFVEANGLPNFLNPSILATVIPSTLLSVCIVKVTGELFEAFCTRRCRVYRRFSLWLYGFAVFLISGFVLLFPFSSPGIARYQSGEISNKTKALIVLSKTFVLLTLTIPFAGLYMLGFEIVGDAGLFLTLMTVCFSLVPIRPLVGKVVFEYRKDVSLTILIIAIILLHSCAVHLLPHITYLMVGIGSIIPAAITLNELRKTHQNQLDS